MIWRGDEGGGCRVLYVFWDLFLRKGDWIEGKEEVDDGKRVIVYGLLMK
jgi:hypothetical protein